MGCFFFFQAEDGIRDGRVTGVQTCALPILWPHDEQEHWLEVFSRSSLPAITVHEVAPGHFAHGRYLRRVAGDVRRTLHSTAFIEGWAHYVEEVCLDEGFRDGDPRFAVGVAVESLQRVTRLAVSIGLHSGSMT